jgi:ferric-dicitrate binding protein FerR (iron transport regulator)
MFHSPIWKYAASVAFFIGVLYTAYYALSVNNTKGVALQVSTIDHIDVFTLPDQSTVDLNTVSWLQYHETEKERSIEFSGEGFFQVTPDRKRPFIIHTPLTTIQVVGTSFNVRAIKGEEEVIVSVSSGTVQVTAENKTQVLTAGRQCIVSGKNRTATIISTKDQNYLSWKTRKIQFENASLNDVYIQLEKTYQTRIFVKDPHLLTCRFTGSFENIQLTQALEILEFSFGIHVTWNDNKTEVTITGGNCNR